MLTKLERDKQKLIQDKCQQILTELLRDDDNKYCVDCDSKGPRWASWNLGIFLCIRCAGIHRNLGVHISKVKSVNLDSWTPEQVGSIQNMGNSKARAVYEANLPDNFCRPQGDSALESFIRAKYEQKKYIAKEWVETTPKPAFDVEAELKKEKEKKRNKIKPIATIGAQSEIQSNPIPRPTASINGKVDQSRNQQQQPKSDPKSASTDLLGLDLISSANEEPFGFFASAEVTKPNEQPTTVQPKESKSLDDEEKDFFSQKAPDKNEEKKLTKESILSLYSQTPNSNALGNTFLGSQSLQTNSLNNFPPVNQSFGPLNTNNQAMLMTSTNPFLANSGNAVSMPLDFPQQNLIQGMSSIQLNSNSAAQIPGTLPGNTQSHLNWFSSGGPVAGGSLVAANPFADSSSSGTMVSNSSNVLNLNFKPNGNANTNVANPLLTINNTPAKENNLNLNNFW